jgi:hypothetical protein
MLRTVILAAIAAVCLSLPAEARPRQIVAHEDCNIVFPCEGVTRSARGERIAKAVGFGVAQNVYQARQATILPHPAGCPRRAFCGCGAAVEVFGRPIRSLWLAANWLRFPRASPAPGMVAARRGHVFVIRQVLGGGRVLAYDANSGGRKTRLHVRSLAGFVVVDPSGGPA